MTLEEFTKDVLAFFDARWPRHTFSEAERCFETEKVRRHIKEEHDRALKEFCAGRLTREQFDVGRASAAGSASRPCIEKDHTQRKRRLFLRLS